MLNSIQLVGRTGRDPEVRYFETGTVKCSVTLAVNRVPRSGEQNPLPDWFDLEFWGKTAEVAGEYVRKGSLIGVSGALDYNRWQDKITGDARERPVIKVEKLDLLGRPRAGDAQADDALDEPF